MTCPAKQLMIGKALVHDVDGWSQRSVILRQHDVEQSSMIVSVRTRDMTSCMSPAARVDGGSVGRLACPF